MGRSDIIGEQRPLQRVFCDDFVLRIPHYQRPYRWKLENADELFSDLLAFLGDDATKIDELAPYFLGSIVLVKDPDRPEADIIDGQQRLTTLTMLLAALRESTGEEFGRELTGFLYEPGKVLLGTPDRYRLRLRDQDADFFCDYVQKPEGPTKLAALGRKLSDVEVRLRENFLRFRTLLEALPMARRQRLASYLIRRCYLVVVSTPDTDSAYRIFSVLNNRGLDLSHADILKAEIIGKIDGEEQQKRYARRWEECEDDIGAEPFKDLFNHLRMIHRRAKLEGTVLAEFRKHVVEKVPDPKKLVDDVIVPGAWAFDQIRRRQWDQEGASDAAAAAISQLLGWLGRLDNEDWVPPAIRIMQSAGDPDLVLAHLRALERLAAFLLVTRGNVNDRVRRYASALAGIEDGTALASPGGSLLLTADEKSRFVAALGGDIYLESKVRVYVLLRLDRALSDKAATYDHDTITVEHVLPQNPSAQSQWLVDFPTPEDRAWTHRLGNLLLLSRRKNSEASNWDFAEKKKRYFSGKNGVSSFALTTAVLNAQTWTPSVVAQRQSDALTTLRCVWGLDAPAPASASVPE